MDRSDRSPGRVAVVMLMAGDVARVVRDRRIAAQGKVRRRRLDHAVGQARVATARIRGERQRRSSVRRRGVDRSAQGRGRHASQARDRAPGHERHDRPRRLRPARRLRRTQATRVPPDDHGASRLGGAEQRDAERVRERSRQGARDPLVVEEPTTTPSGSPTTASTSTPRDARSTSASSIGRSTTCWPSFARGPLARLVAVACPSGRRDTPGKRVGGQLPRGFESLGHRRSRCGDAQSSVSCFVYRVKLERTRIPTCS